MSGANGDMPLDLAVDIAGQMVATGRAIPPARWVEGLREKAVVERSKGLPHNSL